MNKAGKIAYSWLKAQSDSEKIRFIAQALGSVEYQALIKKHQPEKQHTHNLPLSFLKWYLPQKLVASFHGKEIGLRSVPKTVAISWKFGIPGCQQDSLLLRVMDLTYHWEPTLLVLL